MIGIKNKKIDLFQGLHFHQRLKRIKISNLIVKHNNTFLHIKVDYKMNILKTLPL